MTFNAKEIYEKVKKGRKQRYKEEEHCTMLLEVMNDADQGTVAHFCGKAFICESIFYEWLNKFPMFAACYGIGKVLARKAWERRGDELMDYDREEVGCKFEVWRMRGWSRFGIGKNARIRLNLSPEKNPAEHYGELLAQAKDGDFTAGEIKQLMEAINVGLNAHQVFELQKEIDQLKSDLQAMQENNHHGQDSFTDKGTA